MQGDDNADRAREFLRCVITDRLTGASDPSFATLKAKGDTVGFVKDTLAMCGHDVPPRVIFAVSLLAYGCVRLSSRCAIPS